MRQGCLFLLMLFFFIPAFAGTWLTRFSYGDGDVLAMDSSQGINGFRAAVGYQPDQWQWQNWRVFVTGAVARWHSRGNVDRKSLAIWSAAPVVRYNFWRQPSYSPFAEASIGAAYLSNTRFDNRRLGMHFSFQDMFGLGASFGDKKQWAVSWHVIHYSNAGLANHNRGITVPFVLGFSYSFV